MTKNGQSSRVVAPSGAFAIDEKMKSVVPIDSG